MQVLEYVLVLFSFSYDSSHGLCLQKPRKIPGVRLKVTALYISYCTRQIMLRFIRVKL